MGFNLNFGKSFGQNPNDYRDYTDDYEYGFADELEMDEELDFDDDMGFTL